MLTGPKEEEEEEEHMAVGTLQWRTHEFCSGVGRFNKFS
jgi:hypothetical protein